MSHHAPALPEPPADHGGDLSSKAKEALQWAILGAVALTLVGGVSFVHWQYINSSAFDPNTAFTFICH